MTDCIPSFRPARLTAGLALLAIFVVGAVSAETTRPNVLFI